MTTSSILKHFLHWQWTFYHYYNSHVNKTTFFWKPLATSFPGPLAKYTLSPHCWWLVWLTILCLPKPKESQEAKDPRLASRGHSRYQARIYGQSQESSGRSTRTHAKLKGFPGWSLEPFLFDYVLLKENRAYLSKWPNSTRVINWGKHFAQVRHLIS